jgi:uncharacterized membrane protein YvbJ
MKLCPYCSSEMDNDAIVCQHCGRDWRSGVSVLHRASYATRRNDQTNQETDHVQTGDPRKNERANSSWAEITSSENRVLWRFLFAVMVAFFVAFWFWILSFMPS